MGPDKRLYLKSSNPQFKYLEEATFSGIFEDPTEVNADPNTDTLDMEFPLEEALIPDVINGVM